MANTEINQNEVYQYCQDRWDFYEVKDGGYYPSKHDHRVFEDAAQEFGMTSEAVMKVFDKIDKLHVQQQHIERMSKTQMAQMFDNIVKGNAETPWGAHEIKK